MKEIIENAKKDLKSRFDGWINISDDELDIVFTRFAVKTIDKFRDDVDSFEYEYNKGKEFEDNNNLQY